MFWKYTYWIISLLNNDIFNIYNKVTTGLGQQAFDSIAGNTVVPYRSLEKFFNYHKHLFIAIYYFSTFR